MRGLLKEMWKKFSSFFKENLFGGKKLREKRKSEVFIQKDAIPNK